MPEKEQPLTISEAMLQLQREGGMGSVVIYVQNENLEYTDILNPPPPLTKERIIGKTDYDILPEHAAERSRIKRRVLDTGRGERQVTTVLIEGQIRQFDATFLPIRKDGKVRGVLCIAAEVTALVQTQKDLEAAQQMILIKLSDNPNRLLT